MPQANVRSISILKTPQAQDDYTGTQADAAVLIDVLANDLARESTYLYSLDQLDYRSATAEDIWVELASGARVRIVDSQIEYDPGAAYDWLEEGAIATETFTYVTRTANGTLSVATVSVELLGVAAKMPVIEGVVSDGYISGGLVFVDIDGDGAFDEGEEPSTLTDSAGAFSLQTDVEGPIVVIGGTNVDTGLPNLATLSAPAGATVVNPLTTIVQELVSRGMASADATALVVSALGLEGIPDLLTYDILAAPEGDPVALAAQKSATSLAAILTAAEQDTGAEASILDALADLVTTNAPLDLTSTSFLVELYETALAPGSDVARIAGEVGAVTTAISAAGSLSAITSVQLEPPSSVYTIQGTDGPDHLVGTGADALIVGGAGNDYLEGAAGNDQLMGGDGDDELDGSSAGNDTIDGGPGDDFVWLDFYYATSGVTFAFTGNQTVQSGISGTKTLISIERAEISGSDFADHLTGGDGNDSFYGGGGDDILIGGGGEDYFYDNRGNNVMTGGTGRDTFEIGHGSGDDIITDFVVGEDTLRLNQAIIVSWTAVDTNGDGASDAMKLTYAHENGLGNGTVTLLALTEAPLVGYVVHGTLGNDHLLGSAGSDYISGNIGDDDLDGSSAGDDTINGGPGDDTVSLDFSFATSGVTFAFTGDQTVQSGMSGTKTLISIERAEIAGSNFADQLAGGNGNDRLYGGLGGDRLSGGAGADTFVYTDPSESTGLGFDQLVNFSFFEDLLDLPNGDTGRSGLASGYPLRTDSFDSDIAQAIDGLLQPNSSVMLIGGDGDFQGRIFMIVDANGDGNYAAGEDFVFEIVAPTDWVAGAPDFFI